MLKKLFGFIVITLLFAVATQAQGLERINNSKQTTALAASDWVGEYSFEEYGGKFPDGVGAMTVTHGLTIELQGDKLTAQLNSNGYQTWHDLYCEAKAEGNKLMIYYDHVGENPSDDNLFEKGDLLLTLVSATRGKKRVILTNWAKFTPAMQEKPINGRVAFKKEK